MSKVLFLEEEYDTIKLGIMLQSRLLQLIDGVSGLFLRQLVLEVPVSAADKTEVC